MPKMVLVQTVYFNVHMPLYVLMESSGSVLAYDQHQLTD